MKKFLALAVATIALPTTANAAIDLTTLPGYEVVTTSSLNFNAAGGLAGWSVANGKVILGARIISAGDSINDFAVFRPTRPGETWGGFTLGANEYGYAFQARDGQANSGVQFELYYANPLAGYTITQSPQLNYNGAGGYGSLSAPSAQVVSGGGYQFSNSYSSATVNTLALENSVFPNYTFGANEQGWVVAGPNNNLQNPGRIYMISFDSPAAVPEPGTWAMMIVGFGLVGFAMRKRSNVRNKVSYA
jgi:hypothetical protein